MRNLEQHNTSRFDDPDFANRFKEDLAVYLENMITDPKHSDNVLTVAVGSDFRDLPERVREGKTKYDINSWVGDAFATVLGKYHPLSEGDIDRLRKLFFYNG